MAPDDKRPTYDLAEFQRLVRSGPLSYRIEAIAQAGIGGLKLDEDDVVACVLALNDRHVSEGGDFYKTMPSETRPGLFHDVYKPTYEGRRIYCKLQIMTTKRGDRAVVIQFKRDQSR